MKKIKPFILYCMIAFFSWTTVNAQTTHCTNLGFELGDFTNWTGYNWVHSNTVNGSPVPVSLPSSRRQEIMIDPSARDPFTGNVLSQIPPGYKYSARLGDQWRDTSPYSDKSRSWNQSLRYTMQIDSSNALLVLKFAVVLENPNHTEIQEPRFKLTILDQNNKTIQDCANYDVYSSNANVNGFQM